MFSQAVDRCRGGLINLHFIDCGNDSYLYSVTWRCTEIRRLRLVRCYVSDNIFLEVVDWLPLLEDLEISYCLKVTDEVSLCFAGLRRLKSLKINRLSTWRPKMDNDSEAMSIAENMVELRHLQLRGNWLTNRGLKAILDSCSHLESLDLRECYNLELDEGCSLEKRCTESIRNFWGPYDYSRGDDDFYETMYGSDDFESDSDTGDDDDDGARSNLRMHDRLLAEEAERQRRAMEEYDVRMKNFSYF